MIFASISLPHAFLWAFVCLTLTAASLALGSVPAAIAMAPALIALRGQIAFGVRGSRWLARGAQVLALVCWAGAFVITLLPVSPEAAIARGAALIAHFLIPLGGLALLSRAPVGRALLPAITGALIAACLQPEPRLFRPLLAASFLCLIAWLATQDDERGVPVKLRPYRLTFFVLVAFAVAVATTRLLPWAQPQVEGMMMRMITEGEASAGLSTEARLGDIQKLATSSRVAARFYSDRAVDLRARVFIEFDGRSWKQEPQVSRPLETLEGFASGEPEFDSAPGEPLALPSESLSGPWRSGRLIVTAPQAGLMPVPLDTRIVRVEGAGVNQRPSGVMAPSAAPALYSFLYAPAATLEDPPSAELLHVPESLDPRIRNLAATLVAGIASPEQRAGRIQAYFQAGYKYDLEVGEFRTQDPVAEFLFDKKRGYCEYFATSTTLLLRLAGIPARYVTGYAVREFQRTGTHYLIRDQDAHAWAEAYIEGRGWVEIDATPPGDYEAAHGDLGTRGLRAWLHERYDGFVALFRQGGIASLGRRLRRFVQDHAAAILAPVLLLLIAGLWRRRRASAGTPHRLAASTPAPAPLRPELKTLLAEIDRLCAARGKPRSPARSPLEHVLDPVVLLAPNERDACVRAVREIYAERYGGRTASADLLESLRANLRAQTARPAAS